MDAAGRAVAILAVYCLSSIDPANPQQAAARATGAVVTVAMHLWRRNAVLSIVAGTVACIAASNWP
jgi:branched-subunit amino acid transport protein AzlD